MSGQLGVNQSVFDFEEFRRELKIELEHGLRVPEASSDAPLTGKIAWAHLKEFPDSYTRWTDAEAEADKFQATQRVRPVMTGRSAYWDSTERYTLTSTFTSKHKENTHERQ